MYTLTWGVFSSTSFNWTVLLYEMKISYVVNKMNDFCFVNVAYLKIHIFLYVDKLSHWPDSNLYVHLSRLLTFELSTLYLQFFKNPSGSLSFLPLICYQCAYLMGFHMGWVWICHQQESYCTNLVGTPFLLAIKVSSGYSWTLCYLTPIPAHWIEIATLTFFSSRAQSLLHCETYHMMNLNTTITIR